MRLTRDPFIQFLLAGAMVFAVYSYARPSTESDVEKRISIDAETQQWLHSNFRKQFRRPPTRLEMGSLIRRYTTNEVKYRESLIMGLDKQDSIVRRRMMQKFDFLLGNGAAGAIPDDQTLSAWYGEHGEEFALPATISFDHLWFSPDRRGEQTEADASAALAEIRNGNDKPDELNAVGDRFPFDVRFDAATFIEVRNVLGEEFAAKVFEIADEGVTQQWTGPVRSGLGFHLVRVTEWDAGEQPPLDEIHDAVVTAWRDWESKRLLTELITNLQAQYDVKLDEEAIIALEYTPESESVQIGFGSDD